MKAQSLLEIRALQARITWYWQMTRALPAQPQLAAYVDELKALESKLYRHLVDLMQLELDLFKGTRTEALRAQLRSHAALLHSISERCLEISRMVTDDHLEVHATANA